MRIGSLVLLIAAALAACGTRPVDAVSSDPLYASRVAAWSFDEGSGMLVHDGLGHHYDGVLVGGQWIPDGHLGGALRLNRGDWIRVDRFATLGDAFTVSLWVRLSLADVGRGPVATLLSTESWPIGTPTPLMDTGDVLPSGGWGFSSASAPSGTFDFALSGVVSKGLDGTKTLRCCALELERWYHLVGVFDGTARTMSFYEGGLLQDRTTLPGPALPGDTTLYMGRSYIDAEGRGGERMWSGTLDDLTIFDRALEGDEVKRLEDSRASLTVGRRE